MPSDSVDSHHEFETRFRELRLAFTHNLESRFDALRVSLDRLREDPDALGHLFQEAHRLAGSAATFGFEALGRAAVELEDYLKPLVERSTQINPTEAAEVGRLLAHLEHGTSYGHETHVPASVALSVAPGQGLKLAVLEDDLELADELRRQLEYYGYDVFHVSRPDDLPSVLADHRPDLLLVDVVLDGDLGAGPHAVAELGEQGVPVPPTYFISARSDMQARLAAVRAGAKDFFVKPLDIGQLLNRLNLEVATRAPSRVLLVDDDTAVAHFCANVLDFQGFDTRVVTQPLETLEAVREFAPDLILLDLHFPEANGQEIAAVLRQSDVATAVPIVFLSAERDEYRRHACILEGASDFLCKPVAPSDLVKVVRAHLERGHQMRQRLRRDALTGLLNHAELHARLRQEVETARRDDLELAVVMIDVDHFKGVNDTYGHPAGDLVLRGLAHFLRRRLRGTDVVGRYGGEEFSLLLPQTGVEQAFSVVDGLRQDFSAIEHQHDGHSLRVTFSFGIAGFPAFGHPESLWKAADDALYAAKRAGRDRGQIADRAGLPPSG